MNPNAIPGHVSQSGSQRCSASSTARATRSQQSSIWPRMTVRSVAAVIGVAFNMFEPRYLSTTAAHSTPIANSTSGYRQPIHERQVRQRPRSASQLTSGIFSHHASVRPHWRQWERGKTMLSPFGQRLRHTFRKLPKASPKSPAKIVPKTRIIDEVEYTALSGRNSITVQMHLEFEERLNW